ncbi:unnamed protein product [Phytophthora fragariaefolia]|uniref:Unnamed protein product n=1 Tax=Phytophthora fragariaefolia TaxID=1490495 RepID=A0A9W6YMD7_9STRA|nr:unnamed protein product [Phytophthora fragariaefolia]
MQYQTNYPYATTSQQYGAISHLREEQRRRQKEYSKALAQQVAQREQQRQRERELDQQYENRYGSFHHPTPHQQGVVQSRNNTFEPAERGMLDGLGRSNNQNSRTSFARGPPQLHHRLPGGPELQDYAPSFTQGRASYGSQTNFHPANQPSAGNQSVPSDFGLSGNSNHQHSMQQERWHHQQQQQQQQPSHAPIGVRMPSFIPGMHVQTGWPEQSAQANVMMPARSSQFWPNQSLGEPILPVVEANRRRISPHQSLKQSFQPEYAQPEPQVTMHIQNGGRRQRTDIHDGGRGNSEEAERLRRKLQQQQEMQLALERQIEEKRQQKLEAKRRQEEEDRREMERFEEDQRRQRAEQERLQEEKRRKAALEQEKAEQAAAAVAAANQQAKLHQQQKLHAQANQAQAQYQQPQLAQSFQQPQFHLQPPLQPQYFANASSPSRLKNPFTNSRAHLFEDPPPQQSPQSGLVIPNSGLSNQNASPVRGQQRFDTMFPQERHPVDHSMDPSELRRQYDDMREELKRQKQLVNQLRQAQVQIQNQQQHHSPARHENGNMPTLMDLEQLRNELRRELEHREQLHRQELASLKREQQRVREPEYSPRRYLGVKSSIQVMSSQKQQLASQSLTKQQQQQNQQSTVEDLRSLPRQDDDPIDESLVSLRGESEFVYFDGRMTQADLAENNVVVEAVSAARNDSNNGSEEVVLDQQTKSINVEVPSGLEVSLRLSSVKKHSVKQSTSVSPALSPVIKPTREDDAADSEDEAHDFFIRSSPIDNRSELLVSSPASHARWTAASSHRYSQLPPALTSSSPSKESGMWRLESVGTNDASDTDDDFDASLDGEQLEALFQRNVRRHEILVGFQSRVQAHTQDSIQQEGNKLPQTRSAWTELHQQLENNRRTSVPGKQRKLSATSTASNDSSYSQDINVNDEVALVASSKWMPSSLFLPTEQSTRSTLSRYK